MVNYDDACIYKIAHKYSPYVYIGSTTNFRRRKQQHKENAVVEKQNKNYLVYQKIRELGGWNNFEMVLVKKCPCNDKLELTAIEFEYQQLFDANLNSKNAIQEEDYYINRKHLKAEYDKQYREKNKEKIKENKKKYQENNREEIKENKKEYYQINKEVLDQKQKIYNEKNKEKILKKYKEKIKCECGCIIVRSQITRHRKTPKHLKLMSC
tara:strand:+ start:87 stop:716 length:630 start_codon:yes stop_codon:yes gene_type:complete